MIFFKEYIRIQKIKDESLKKIKLKNEFNN